MYRFEREHQIRLDDFNQPMGMKLNPNNRWVVLANSIPWESIELKYAKLFPSHTGMPAKPLRMALGALLLQKKTKLVDVALVLEIMENPYMQFFIGLPGYTEKQPFVPSLMVEFRKRLNEEILGEINEMIIAYNEDHEDHDDQDLTGTDDEKETHENVGTLILDATCAPQNIRFPQDINLLNESRENLETMIDKICSENDFKKPRTYRKNARRDYLRIARSKKRNAKKMRKAIRQQLQYVRRDLKYLDDFLSEGVNFTDNESERLNTIKMVYEQQKYMHENRVHTVENRIVSISQPYIRPIVRGKAKAPTEFGAKLDLSIDEKGLARIEKISFDAYNESEILPLAVERYKERNGHYPKRVLVDKIYRNRNNINFCKERDIRISGPSLGRPKKDPKVDKKAEYIDNADRVEVERAFSLAKRCYGLGLIRNKREDTTKGSIALSIIAMNLDRIIAIFLPQIGFKTFWDYLLQMLRIKSSSDMLSYLEACC